MSFYSRYLAGNLLQKFSKLLVPCCGINLVYPEFQHISLNPLWKPGSLFTAIIWENYLKLCQRWEWNWTSIHMLSTAMPIWILELIIWKLIRIRAAFHQTSSLISVLLIFLFGFPPQQLNACHGTPEQKHIVMLIPGKKIPPKLLFV